MTPKWALISQRPVFSSKRRFWMTATLRRLSQNFSMSCSIWLWPTPDDSLFSSRAEACSGIVVGRIMRSPRPPRIAFFIALLSILQDQRNQKLGDVDRERDRHVTAVPAGIADHRGG